MSQPAHLLFDEHLSRSRAEGSVGECKLAVQSIRALPGAGNRARFPWLEFLIRPFGRYGHMKPFEYVHMMYDSPLGLSLDDAVCGMVLNWLKQQPYPYRASINIHPGSLARPEFADWLLTEIEESGIEGERVCLELVEFAEMVSIEASRAQIERLKNAGIKLAIDDYGRGMPCFELYGAGFIDYIKVDRAYIKDICFNPGHAALLKGIASLARELDAEVIAEGLECAEQLKLLSEIGVPWGQGYFFEKPRLIEL